MASAELYKLDDGKPHLSNCFPAKNLLRTPEEAGRGHWLVARKGGLKKKPKNVAETTAEGQEGQKVSFEVEGKKGSRQENQVDTPGHMLDLAFLLKHHCVKDPSDLCSINVSGLKFSKAKEKDFKHFNSVIYINASENLLPLGLCAHREASVTSLTTKRYILRFPALETLMLDDNKLSNPNCFVSLAGLKRLKKLSLDQNRIFRIPYLQQVQLRDGSGDWVGGRGSPRKQPQSMLQSKSWIYEASDDQPDYTILPMKKDVDRTEVVFSSYPGFSTSETTKVCALPPIFEILPVKSLKARNQTLAPPFPELRYLSLAYNKIAKEDAILPVALFPSLCELIFHNNPLVAHTRGVPPLLKSFLQERLGIHLIRRKIVKAKHHILMPRKDSRKVKTQVPKVPKQPMILPHPSVMIKSPSKEMLESEAELTTEPPPTKTISVEREMPIEGLGGPPMPHRTFVPLPPICSDSTVHSEETSPRSDAAGRLSADQLSDEDTKSTESIFLTQVSGLSSSIFQRDDSEIKEKEQRPPSTAPREAKRTQKKPPSASFPRKYHGYEELLTAKPDPTFVEPKGIQKNAQALQHMLKHPLVYRSSKPRLDTLQKHYVPKEKRTRRIPVPPRRKTRAQLLDDILIRMRDTQNITEAPLGAVLRQRTEQRLVNQKQFLEAKKLLKEFRARYRRLVRCSLRSVFGTTAPPQARPALSGSQPKLGRFLEFMDEFYQEPTASDLKG
ncbi:X-ray radiation resistance-associated protein 1 isoform X3 [Bos indicus x Bos taurus]|uniref:X-ray radiation resistance-associated protein 1 isoform X3 n=1 Tax=Bos indicus x Bos taurus TaxID=30522 RepID=UPI000F7D5717|nr:X-ray radiation resistance-associated protein 1 isoform X3 [Bos indicus x Bos taurus]